MALADVLQLIQQQQALEERKEERQHDLALQFLSQDIAQESRLKEVELQGTISEYYDLKKEREEVYSTLQKEYPRLDEKFLTDNFHTVKNTFQGVAENNMSNLRNNMDQLIEDISGLESLDRQLSAQKSYYKGQEQAIAGITADVDPGEFKTFVEEYEEKFPDAPTAGLYAAYDAGKIDTYTRRKRADEMQSTSKAFAQSNWDSILQLATHEDFEVSNYMDNEVLESEFATMISFKNYPDALNYMNMEPTGKVKDVFYKIFPGLMDSMEGHVESVDTVESEFLGREKDAHVENIINKFVGSLPDKVSNKEAFSLYDQAQGQLTNEEDKKAMFAAMEQKMGKGDLYKGKGGYKEYLLETSKFDPKKPYTVSRLEHRLSGYEGLTNKETATKIYESLDALGPEGAAAVDLETWGLSDPTKWSPLIVGTAPAIASYYSVDRPEFSTAKGLFGSTLGGLMDWDSPYYETFYDEMQNIYANLLDEENPMGPNWAYNIMGEEWVPETIKNRYGNEIYRQAFDEADRLARESQIEHMASVLEKGEGSEYSDLLHSLKILETK